MSNLQTELNAAKSAPTPTTTTSVAGNAAMESVDKKLFDDATKNIADKTKELADKNKLIQQVNYSIFVVFVFETIL